MRTVSRVAVVGACLGLLMFLLVAGSLPKGRPAQASPDGVVTTIAIDMDPNDGSGSPVNDEDTVGNIDPCARIDNTAGQTVTFDVVVDAIPLTVRNGNVSGFAYAMNFNGAFTVSAVDHTTAGTVLLHRNPGGWMPNDFSQGQAGLPWPPPIGISMSDLSAAGIEGNGESPANPAGGVLGRYTLTYDGTLTDGIYTITLTGVGYGGSAGAIYDDPTTGAGIDDDGDGGVDEDILLDGNATPTHGMIAVGVDCGTPMASPTPEPTSSPSPGPPSSPSPGPPSSPSPTATPPPTTVYLVNGWNLSCYVGAAQPIENALADVLDHVLAIYRLSSDQAFEGWFPNRPDDSTIATLDSHEALFILMANSASWTQQSLGSPPTAKNLSEGWSSVCYAGEAKDVANATASIEGKFAVLYALGPDQSWQGFVPAKSDAGSLSQLDTFTAVLILVTDESGAVWVFDP